MCKCQDTMPVICMGVGGCVNIEKVTTRLVLDWLTVKPIQQFLSSSSHVSIITGVHMSFFFFLNFE